MKKHTSAQKGKKDKDDCEKILVLVQAVLDGEATEHEERRLYRHISNCNCCLKEYHIEHELKKLIHLKIEHLPVPEHIVESIRRKLLITAQA